MVIERWRKQVMEQQTIKMLKYNLEVGKMDEETRLFINNEIRTKTALISEEKL